MIKIITPEKLKTALSEMKVNIVNKFYNKIEIDNTINQTKIDINSSIQGKLDENNIEIKKETAKIVDDKLVEYDGTLDKTIQDKVDAKEFDTSGLIKKSELDISKVITTDNLEANNIATKEDLTDIVIDTSTLLDKETYLSKEDTTSVKKSVIAKKIDGIAEAPLFSYYGKDKNGNIGFQEFPISISKDDLNNYSATILKAKTNNVYTIDLKESNKDVDTICQAYKFIEGDKDIISIIKNFNNSDSNNFYYNENNVEFLDDKCRIKNDHIITGTNNNSIYESPIIKKGDFTTLENITIKK